MKFLKFGTKFLIFPNPNLSCHLDWSPLRIIYVRMKFDKIIRLFIIWNPAFWLANTSSFSLVNWKLGLLANQKFSVFRNGSKSCENRPHLISKISIRVHWLIYFVRLIQLVSRRNRNVVCDYRRRYQSVKFTKIDFLEIFLAWLNQTEFSQFG